MKTLNLFLASIMMIAGISLSAQTDTTAKRDTTTQKSVNVPQSVMDNFSKEYPQTPDTKWKMERGSYVVEYTTADMGNKKIWYNEDGKKQFEERTLNSQNDLPTALREVMTGKYAGYRIIKIAEVKNVGRTSYRIRMEKDGDEQDITLNASGQEVK